MKKFKLIKEYPGSPKMPFYIETEDEALVKYHREYKEFWQEVKVIEKDYEILTIRRNKNYDDIYLVKDYNENGAFLSNFSITHRLFNDKFNTLKDSLEYITNNYHIHSVKRLSDGEIFTIGDKILGHILEEIFIAPSNKNDIVLSCKDLRRALYLIEDKHLKIDSKLPLFKTEDGVDVYEDDSVYWVINNEYTYQLTICKNHITVLKNNDVYKIFSTEEKAREYVLMNKPYLSINDVISIIDNSSKLRIDLIRKTKELVKEKLDGNK